MEPDDGLEEEGPFFAWLPPDDRLWRHPSEVPPGVGSPDRLRGDRRGRPGLATLLIAGAQNPTTRIWTVAVVAALVGALAASSIGMVSGAFQQPVTVIHSVISSGPVETLASASAARVDWTTINQALAPSVVDIDVSTAIGPASGSGFLFMPGNHEEYVITTGSLVSQASDIHVTFMSGDQYPARLVGQDRLSGLALIAVPTWHRAFPPLGSVTGLQVANRVLSVGAGASGGSVFEGLVTAQDRQVDVTGGIAMQNLIAVSGPPLPSTAAGGPLVTQHGQIVGITLSVVPTDTSDQPLTFAVPVDVARHVAQQLLEGTAVTHPWLGVTTASDITSAEARQYGLAGGAKVDEVAPSSPAGRLGLSSSDIITSFDNQAVVSTGTLTQLVCQAQLGRKLLISYIHKGKPVQANVSLWNQPDGD